MLQSIADWYLNLPPAVQAGIRALHFFLFVFGPLPIFIWGERRVLAWMQDRVGPNRTGTITFKKGSWRGRKFRVLWGIPQIVCDGVKGFFKEDLAPAAVDRTIFFIAPALTLFPAFALGATIPLGAWRSLTPVADVNIGVLYMLAISSLGVYGVVLAGYSSNNKYSLMGGLRSSAQLISYELSMGMALAAVVLATGSLKLTDIVKAQGEALYGAVPFIQNWFVFTPFGLVAGVVFYICMLAETNRPPFDLPECESELISGYNTEYSTKKWVLFMMGEYVAMFTFSLVLSTVFLGGYNLLPVRWDYLAQTYGGVFNTLERAQFYLGPIVLAGKGFALMFCYIWVRGSFPRLRYDQLMSLGWKNLLPISTANFVVVAIWLLGTRLASEKSGQLVGALLGWGAFLIGGILAYLLVRSLKATGGEGKRLATRTVTLVDVVATAKTVEAPAPEPVGGAA